MVFLVILGLAIIIGIEVGPIVKGTDFETIISNIVSALIAAVVVGVTYEYLLYSTREETLGYLFEEHRKKVFEALRAHMLLTPDEIFDLLKNIATQTRETPTLYRPPREEGGEYTFAESVDYFTVLINVRRAQIEGILDSWISPQSHRNLKFLASDFIGLYKLDELAPKLLKEAFAHIQNIVIDPEKQVGAGTQSELEPDHSWMLNYIWAASRCQNPMYSSLGDLLCSTKDARIQNWILFVPLQMPDCEFFEIIDAYLKKQNKFITEENLKATIRALAQLERWNSDDRFSAAKILCSHSSLFDSTDLRRKIELAWSSLGLTPKPEIKSGAGKRHQGTSRSSNSDKGDPGNPKGSTLNSD